MSNALLALQMGLVCAMLLQPTADNGRALVSAAGRSLAQLLTEISKLPPTTLVDRPQPD